MPTTTIVPIGDAWFITNVSGYAEVVGAAPQLGDGSDDTYGTAGYTNDGSRLNIDDINTYLPASGVDPASVTDISIMVRGKTTNSTTGTLRAIDVGLYDPSSNLLVDFGRTPSALWDWPNDDAIHDNVSDVTADNLALTGKTLLDVATTLATAYSRVSFRRVHHTGDPTPFTYKATVYDLAITLTWDATALIHPTLRQLQRGDGYGMSSAPRAFQHGSQQGSLRQLGGFR
jgi:hypothetical protein